jgi:uncharacterized membrane protein YidH (DUF202 family)
MSRRNRLLAHVSLTDETDPLTEAHPQPILMALGDVPTEAMVRQESMIINEVSLILAEKRTALSVMRTGLAILVLPISVFSILIAISRYYDPGKVIYLLAPLLGVSFLLGIFGLYLIFRSWRRSQSLDQISLKLKQQNARLKDLCSLMDELKPKADASKGRNA